MKMQIEEKIRNDPKWAAAVDRANLLLQAELGPTGELASASWNLVQDNGSSPRVDLTLSDWSGAVEGRFSFKDLQSTPFLQRRLNRLWGDLLEIRSDKQIAKLHKLIQQMNED